MSGICPCCGYNLTADEPVERGPWLIDPRRGVFFNGEIVTRRETWTQILLTLARLDGQPINSTVLQSRITKSENVDVIASQISQFRKHCKALGVDLPIASVRGSRGGYWWSA